MIGLREVLKKYRAWDSGLKLKNLRFSKFSKIICAMVHAGELVYKSVCVSVFCMCVYLNVCAPACVCVCRSEGVSVL